MQSVQPQVSVAMATYNGERYVRAQLQSILQQLAPTDELIVVDDASTDRTREVVAAVGDPRVKLHANERNLGVFASFERALSLTRGRIVFLADQDDLWLDGKRRALVDVLERSPRVLLAIGDAALIDSEGQATESSFMRLRGGFRGSFLSTLVKNRYLGCAMAFRRELLAYALPIPRDVPMHDMWLGALATCIGQVVYIDRPLMQYRRHGGNVTPDRRQSVATMLRWRWRLLKNVLLRLGRGSRPLAVEVSR
jgi:glycosyltransferase involved in cell wall biosynthesis